MLPETRYARLGELHLAYQVLGSGPPDLLLLDQWFSHMEAQWDVPPLAEFRERLAAFGRLIMFDKRGTGLSDPVPTSDLPSIDEWMDDVPAVLDAVGSERAAVITNIGGGIMAMTFAAAHPERVSHLVLVDCFARYRRHRTSRSALRSRASRPTSTRPTRGPGSASCSTCSRRASPATSACAGRGHGTNARPPARAPFARSSG